MKIVVFGLSVSSSWGNGHATLWRGLIAALGRQGHAVVFFERDVPYYAASRDLHELPGGDLVLFGEFAEIIGRARRELADADAAIVTSYCPDGIAATELMLDAPRPLHVFYDLDTPVTLSRLGRGESLDYIGPRGLADFDLVLSYTGGGALAGLREQLGARCARALHGHVDPSVHRPVQGVAAMQSELSYLGTYAADRQAALEMLFIATARQRPAQRFLIAGAQYPQDFPWTENIFFLRHLPPEDHPAFYSSSRLTVNVTRRAMAEMGWCPSGRLFEAAACGVPLLSDDWPGLSDFFERGEEILVARSSGDAVAALDLSDAELRRMAGAARARVLEEHTSGKRAAQLEAYLNDARAGASASAQAIGA